mgnify:CR=1 FL=1
MPEVIIQYGSKGIPKAIVSGGVHLLESISEVFLFVSEVCGDIDMFECGKGFE